MVTILKSWLGYVRWRLTSAILYSSSGTLPTTYQGVFSRDNMNNLYLSGFHVVNGTMFQRGGLESWYLRDGPVITGVKDRASNSGDGLTPALSEINWRIIFDEMGDESSGDLLSKYFLQMGMGRTEIVMFGCGRRLLEESIRFAMRQWEVVEFLVADSCFRRAIQTSPLPIRLRRGSVLGFIAKIARRASADCSGGGSIYGIR